MSERKYHCASCGVEIPGPGHCAKCTKGLQEAARKIAEHDKAKRKGKS